MPSVRDRVRELNALDDNMTHCRREHKHKPEHEATPERVGVTGETRRQTFLEMFRDACKEVTGTGELFPGAAAPIGRQRVLCRGALCFVHPGGPLGPLPLE